MPQPGVSLLEALIVLAVAGIILSLGYWRMAPALERAQVRRAASVLAADLQYAQSVAARQRTPVVFLVTPSVQAYLVRDRSNPAIEYRARYVGPDTDYAIQTLSASPSNSIEIFPNGVTVATTTFTVARGTYQRQVRITRAGQIRVLLP
jgi:prepilin-type N-terminal cleavage/methylation domain-containing protein